MLSIAPSTRTGRRQPRTLPGSLATSIMLHVLVAAAVFSLSAARGVKPIAVPQTTEAHAQSPIELSRIVFIAPTIRLPAGGGGGGGGNRQSGPIRRAESRGHDAMTLRIARPIAIAPDIVLDAEPRLPALLLDAKPLASGFSEHVGLPTGGVTFGMSTGPGSGGGVGAGTGTGIGSGRGPGLGEGNGGGTGGGVYRVGGSVSSPVLVRHVRPSYTTRALELRIQGSVVLELIVTDRGVPSRIQVVRSLDPDGLDEEAVKAVKEWMFAPGRLSGTPVPVLVTVVVDFTIR